MDLRFLILKRIQCLVLGYLNVVVRLRASWGKVDPEAKSGVQASVVGQVTDLPGEAGDAVMP